VTAVAITHKALVTKWLRREGTMEKLAVEWGFALDEMEEIVRRAMKERHEQ
jgi:hypothetical protein